MSRKPRIHYPGAHYHVMLRGNGGDDIFLNDADRCRFLLLLQHGVERFHHRVHAYCLMSNHVHLVIQVAEVPLSRIMQNLSFRFTQYMNWRRKKTGHLFQGRFKALLIDADSYLLELIRYVHLNPLRAGLASGPDDYPWSSHGAYLGRDTTPWLTTHLALGMLDTDAERDHKAYGLFLQDGIGEGYRVDFHSGTFEGRVLGTDDFVEQALEQTEQLVTHKLTVGAILEAVCGEYKVSLEDISSPSRQQPLPEARAVAAWLVWQSADLSLQGLANSLCRDISGLSQAVRRLGLRLIPDRKLMNRIERIQVQARKSVCQA